MCGILGVLSPNETDRAAFQAALDIISHRGPDGEGRFDRDRVLLGHRRLAILDLSHLGDQPMIDATSGVTIVFNGEIYNYIEVRDELQASGVRFKSHSDTEVLLQAYIKWGAGMLPRLNGMWAFAIWDPRSESLLLSRDRFGVKPLYYAVVAGRLLFASEPKALFRLDPTLASPNPRGIADFFASSEMHASAETFFRDVKSLPAASYAIVHAGQGELTPRAYWAYPDGAGDDTQDFEFESVFSSAVALRLRSDVPVGLTLSGGLDSSAILAACSEISPRPLRCFTSVYGSEQRGEEDWARKAADIAGAPLVSVDSSLQDWHATLEHAVRYLDSPSYSPAIIPLWAIMKAAKAQGVTVLLEGQGADELLGGYPRYFPAMLAQMMGSLDGSRRAAADLSRLSSTFGWKWMMLWSLRQALPGPYRAWSRKSGGSGLLRADVTGSGGAVACETDGGDLFDLLRADHSKKILPALLHYGDAIAMAHGVESRLPFMDYRLVERVFRTRPALMVDGRTKAPIRNYLNDHGFGVIASRMDKRGYPTPVMDWLKGLGGVFIEDTLADGNNPIWDYLLPARVSALLKAAAAGSETAVFQLFKVATAAIWLANTREARTSLATSSRH